MRLLLLLSAALPALLPACSCSPLAAAPACELVGHAPVILRGQVLGTEHLQVPPFNSAVHLFRLRVDRVYQGLPPATAEVLVEGDPSDPCGQSYNVGEEYLLFAVPGSRGDVPLLFAGQCSGSRPVSHAAEDLRFLELYRAGQARTRIFGKTLQSVFRDPSGSPIPVAQANVTLRSSGALHHQLSGADGSYSFEDVPPGGYELSAALTHFYANPHHQSISIVPGGCALRHLELKPDTRLTGVAVDRDGTPVPDAEVQLLRRDPQGEWADDAAHATTTDSTGQFVFANVAAVEYFLGFGIERDGPTLPSSRAAARAIHLLPAQPIEGLRLTVPEPDPPRSLTIWVTWPNGRSLGPHLLQLSANQRVVHNGAGDALEYNFAGLANRTYVFRARYWVDDLSSDAPPAGHRLAISNAVTVEPGSAPRLVHLILGPPSVPPPH